MEGNRQSVAGHSGAPAAAEVRHFREQEAEDERPVPAAAPVETPLEVNMTDEPGGDPYNHTGSFRRLFR